MPDQLPSSILNPTLSDDSLFALNLDTKRRFEAMNETFQQPMSMPDYSVPQSSLTDNSITKGTIGEALFNPDPKIAKEAQNAIQNKMNGLSTKSNIGVPEFFHYDKSMDKYLNKVYGYNPYISMADNEDFYYENQYLTKSPIGKLLANTGKGLTRFGTGVGLKLVQTLGQTAGLLWNGVQEAIEAVGGPQNNAMADVADNGLARWAMHAEEYLKNTNTLAVFKPSDWEDKGFFNKLFSGAFWSDEIADGAAFMGEMVLSTYLLGGAGKLAGLSKFGATSINTASKLGKGGKALDWGIKALTGANDISGIGRWAFLTASESAMEASEGYKNHKERLQIERSLGKNNYTDDQIVKLAGDVASSQFKDNLLILGLSSSFENRFIFEPLFGKAGRAVAGKSWRSRIGISSSTKSVDDLAKAELKKYNYNTLLGKFSDWKNPNSRLNFYGKRFGKATLAEGYWEENAQLATERLSVDEGYNSTDWIERKYQLARKTLGQAASTLPKWTGVPGSEVTDKEADTAIGLGSVIGVLGTGIIAKAAGGDRNISVEDKDKPGEYKQQKNGWFEGERRKIERTAQEAINVYEKGRREFLGFNDIYEKTADQLDKDGNIIKKGEIIKDEFGNPIIDTEKAKGVLDGIYKMSAKFDAISVVEDPLHKKFLQDKAIGTFVLAAKAVGLFEKSLNAFNNLDKVDAKQLEELGFDPNTTVDYKWMQETLEETGKAYDETYKNSQVPKKGQTERDENTRKHTLFTSRVTANSANRLSKEYDKANTKVLVDTLDIDNLEEFNMDVQQYNHLILQKQKLEQFKKTTDLKDDFFAEHIKAQEEKIDNKLAELTASISLSNNLEGGTKLSQSPDTGLYYSTERYAHLSPTRKVKLDNVEGRLSEYEAKEIRTSMSELDLQLIEDHKSIFKQVELLNVAAQYEYLATQLSHPENGIDNVIAYQKHLDNQKKKDEKADEEEVKKAVDETGTKINEYSIVPVLEDESTTFDVVDKNNKIVGNFETEEEAKVKIEELSKEVPKEKPKEKPKEDNKLTYDELRSLALDIVKTKMKEFGLEINKDDEEILKLIPELITNEISKKELKDEELAALTEYIEAYNKQIAKQVLAPEEIESFGYKIRLEPDGKWKIYTIDGESLGLTFDTKELAIKETELSDIERRRQEELDNLFSKTQASTDKQLNTPVQKLSKEEINRNIETAKQQNKDLIEELEKEFKENTDNKASDEVWDKWDKKSDKLDNNLPQGVSFRITDGKVDFFDSQSYREKGFGKNIVQVSVGNLHNKTEKFEVGDNLQVQDGSRAMPAIVTKVNEHGKILEAKQEDGRIIISRGNIITLAPINDRLKINAKYDAELKALEQSTSTNQSEIDKKADIERRRQEEISNKEKTGEPENISQPIELTIPKEEIKEEPPVTPPSGIPGISSGELYNEVKHAYDLWDKALIEGTSFKEEADKENLVAANNEINRRIDDGKNTGKITIVTSNPKELADEKSLITVDNDINLLRYNFLNKLRSGKIDKNKVKLLLLLSKDGRTIFARITDNNGKIIYFDKNANRTKEGMHLDILLDGLDLYSAENLPKRRSDIVKFGNLSPLSSNPVILNEVFLKDKKPRTDILDILKARIAKENVLASIDFITQGILVREGSTNKYNNIPKNLPTRTIEELQKNGELVETIGSITLSDTEKDGIFQKKQRINFSLWRNVNDHEEGSEIVEFRPIPLGEVQTSDGKNLMESLQVEVNGTKMSIFEAGVQGILPGSPRMMYTLKSLLRPDKFIVLNLGNTIMIINAIKFTKFLKSGTITLDELKKLTSLDDVMNSELNVFAYDYNRKSVEDMIDGILIDDNYMDFINKNVRTSVLSVKKEPNSIGVARINKRLVVTLDKNITDMLKEENQVDITGKTTVIPVETMDSPLDIEKLFEESKGIDPDEISKGITKNDC